MDEAGPTWTKRCACVAVDAYDCWDRRYHIERRIDDAFDPNEPSQRERVEIDGGPCECGCHYEDDAEEGL